MEVERRLRGIRWVGLGVAGTLLLGISLAFPPHFDQIASVSPTSETATVVNPESEQERTVLSEPRVLRRAIFPAPAFRTQQNFAAVSHGLKKEKDFYSAFSRLAKNSDGSLEREAELSLKGKGPNCEKVAALRALYDWGSARAPELFLYVIRTPIDSSKPQGESVPSFAVRFLGEKASRDLVARETLEKAVMMGPAGISPELRRHAAASLARYGSEAELCRLYSSLSYEGDSLLVQETLASLSENANVACANRLLGNFDELAQTLSNGQNARQ